MTQSSEGDKISGEVRITISLDQQVACPLRSWIGQNPIFSAEDEQYQWRREADQIGFPAVSYVHSSIQVSAWSAKAVQGVRVTGSVLGWARVDNETLGNGTADGEAADQHKASELPRLRTGIVALLIRRQ